MQSGVLELLQQALHRQGGLVAISVNQRARSLNNKLQGPPHHRLRSVSERPFWQFWGDNFPPIMEVLENTHLEVRDP